MKSITTKEQFLEKYDQQIRRDLWLFNRVAEECNTTITLFGGLCDLHSDYLRKT